MSSPSVGGASRDGYGAALLRIAENPKVVVLEADLGKSTKSCLFRSKYPERTFSLGISEQNMMLVAAGLAEAGKIPFASTFAIFTERGFEQIRNGIARPGFPVHICGSHGGIHTGTDGSSAQSIEDLAIYRAIPGMAVIHPSDDLSAEELTVQLQSLEGPSYMRTARNKTRRIYDDVNSKELRIGKGSTLRSGSDAAIVACGVMVERALDAANSLSGEGVECTVIDMHTIKPLDEDLLSSLAEICGCIVTAEDHSIIGGLGGSVAEWSALNCPVPVEMVGVMDRFGESGSTEDLMREMGLNPENIVDSVKKCISRKNEL